MQTVTLKARTDSEGIVKIEIPTELANRDFDIVLVLQPVTKEPVDAMGYPLGYFEETYGSFADQPLEREQPTAFDKRDELE